MIRADIINIIGREYLTSNIENGEYSYPKASREAGVALSSAVILPQKPEVTPKSWTY